MNDLKSLPNPGRWVTRLAKTSDTLRSVQEVSGVSTLKDAALLVHRARLHQIPPELVRQALPFSVDAARVVETESELEVRSDGDTQVSFHVLPGFWAAWFERERWVVSDILRGLIETFVRRLVLKNPAAIKAIRGRAVILVGNHQTSIESLLFSVLGAEVLSQQVVTIAKKEHRSSPLGLFIKNVFSYPGIRSAQVVSFIDRKNPLSVMASIRKMKRDLRTDRRSLMVHADGTRALSARKGLEKISGKFIDLALETNTPIVPVRFVGGLPIEPLPERTDLPHRASQQDFWIGAPILPETLATTDYESRKRRVKDAVNQLGVPRHEEEPLPPRPELDDRIRDRQAAWRIDPLRAAVIETLCQLDEPSPGTQQLLAELNLSARPTLAADHRLKSNEARWILRFARWLRQPNDQPGRR